MCCIAIGLIARASFCFFPGAGVERVFGKVSNKISIRHLPNVSGLKRQHRPTHRTSSPKNTLTHGYIGGTYTISKAYYKAYVRNIQELSSQNIAKHMVQHPIFGSSNSQIIHNFIGLSLQKKTTILEFSYGFPMVSGIPLKRLKLPPWPWNPAIHGHLKDLHALHAQHRHALGSQLPGAEEAAAARVFSHEAQSSEQPGTPSECHRTPGFWGFLNGMTS